ncbi:lasso peptide biosynthesis B2 protein [Deinococcus roseus]|uniref:Microcin J25-processing protein McjB C-terminal domain-containing protein n=1 Tax=Deinococcus roseus TaxID=392414 RepID=A0ABQ2CX63_9DEIO|nr:lasso peptide biosynthesis B2 protein [Deinococcus roseus]GGJ28299.1 hypothetical protein GCM10008938_12980 [Deinococcus roseus]
MDDLTRALTCHDFESLPVTAWQNSNLAPYVFKHTSNQYRKGLLPHYAQALYRWKAQATELKPLLQAWNAVGIVPLLIKGAALALRHYTEPCERYFGDIDLVVDPGQIAQARELAASLGWVVLFDAERDQGFSNHEALGLMSPGKNIKLDVHHALLKHPARFAKRAEQLQQQLEPEMETFDWEGVQVRLLGLADMALVSLILHRAWYRDRWNLKRYDYLDLYRLKQAGLTREHLLERAEALGCRKTAELFLQRCDPYQQVLSLKVLTPEALKAWEAQVSEERGFTAQQAEQARKQKLFSMAPGMARDVLTGMGWVSQAAQVLQHQQSLQALCERIPLRSQPANLQEIHKARIGVLGASRVLSWLPRGKSGMCVLRSVAMLWWLRNAGIDAELVSGVRNAGGTLKGHAWIEYQGTVLAIIAEDSLSPLMYKVNYRSKGQQNAPHTPSAAAVQGGTATR